MSEDQATIKELRRENEELKAWQNGAPVRNYRAFRAYQDEAACLATALRGLLLTVETLLDPKFPPVLHQVVRAALVGSEGPSDLRAKRALESYDRLVAQPVKDT